MHTTEAALAASSTLVAVAFALCTLERFLARRRRHELAWTISLAMFAVASASLWVGAAAGWTGPTFRVFYLFCAILDVPWLALGSVYLLGGRRHGDPWALVVIVVSAFAAGVMTVAPLTGAIPAGDLPQGSEVFGPLPRILAAVCSGVSATVVVVLAVVSALRLLRGRSRSGTVEGAPSRGAARRLALANGLIAAGTLVLGASGTLNARLGAMTAFSITLTIGISVLFAGFLIASGGAAVTSRSTVEASAQDPAQELAAEPTR
jgi:hypothetical protein